MAQKKASKTASTAKKTTAKTTVKETVEPKAPEVVEEKKLEEPKAEAAKELEAAAPKAAEVKEAKAADQKAEKKEEKAAEPKADKKEVKAEEPKAETKATPKAKSLVKEEKAEKPKTRTTRKAKAAEPKAEAPKAEAPAKEEKTEEVKAEKAAEPEKPKARRGRKPKTEAATETVKEEKPKKRTTRKTKTAEVKAEEPKKESAIEEVKAEPVTETAAEVKAEPVTEPEAEEVKAEPVTEPEAEEPKEEVYNSPRKSVVFIGSECYPFVKTGGLGDVMYALPKALVKQNCDVKVILPKYKCIPWKYQEKMVYRGSFDMSLCSDGRSFYVGIMEYVWDGVVYDFIDNEEFFSDGNPYTNLIDDIPKYCYFAKAALAALNYMDWIPDIIHCHDWQAALVPVYLRTMFENTRLTTAKTILTIHNLRFQGIYNIPTLRYWTGLPDYVFNKDALKQGYNDANMLKGGLTYSNIITTVSNTYAGEIQTAYYGENLDDHMRYHNQKLRGIVNGIDCDIWNPATDPRLYVNYDITNVLEKKKENKRKMQEELGLVQDDHKFVIGLISRLTDQKGLDLINAIIPQIMDEHTQIVVLGTGDQVYEDSFRYYENTYKGNVCSNIMYDETRAHKIYAGADAFLVPSRFEPCGLTQLIAMHYGTIPIVRETGGLKDTVEPYNMFTNAGNGFTFDHYDAGLLLDAINRAKTLYFTNRWCWDEMVQRDMDKIVSWDNAAKQYKDLYLELAW